MVAATCRIVNNKCKCNPAVTETPCVDLKVDVLTTEIIIAIIFQKEVQTLALGGKDLFLVSLTFFDQALVFIFLNNFFYFFILDAIYN